MKSPFTPEQRRQIWATCVERARAKIMRMYGEQDSDLAREHYDRMLASDFRSRVYPV